MHFLRQQLVRSRIGMSEVAGRRRTPELHQVRVFASKGMHLAKASNA